MINTVDDEQVSPAKKKRSDYSTELSKGQVRISQPHEFHLKGAHEIQVSESEEADLHKHFNECEKNPGHVDFIPYENFSLEDIPEGYRDNDLFEFIKVVADLTVRLVVKTLSPMRPKVWPESDVPYPFYKEIESDLSIKKDSSRYGSGQINEVIQLSEGLGKDRHGKVRSRDYKTCICSKCQNSDNPSKVWWEIVVRTATHVVFDEVEASKTSCRLFFDHPKSPVIKIDDLKLLEVNIHQDWCLISYVSCGDLPYRDELLDKVIQRVDLWKKVCQKFQKSEPSTVKQNDEVSVQSLTSVDEVSVQSLTSVDEVSVQSLTSVDEVSVQSLTSVDEVSVQSLTSVDEVSVQSLTSVDEVSVQSLTSVDEASVQSLTSVDEASVQSLTSVDEASVQSLTSVDTECSKTKNHIKKWRPGDNLTFIVSHPHGYSKQISFGFCERSYLLGKFDQELDLTKLIYTTPTCPGSSGAAVRCVGLGVGHVHSGTLPEEVDNHDEILPKGWNYSGVSLVYRNGSPYVWDQRRLME